MRFRTVLRDCLYVNWALPLTGLPELPASLRYQVHRGDEGEIVFASGVFFRQEHLRLRAVPVPRFSYPQFNLRLCVLDEVGEPSVFFITMLIPFWVVPGARWVAGQPAGRAEFSYPWRSRMSSTGAGSWRVQRRGGLIVSASPSSPYAGVGPSLGTWDQTVSYIRRRSTGYALAASDLRRVDFQQQAGDVIPVTPEVLRCQLLADLLPSVPAEVWEGPHSSWFCPEVPAVFETGDAESVALPRGVPAPG